MLDPTYQILSHSGAARSEMADDQLSTSPDAACISPPDSNTKATCAGRIQISLRASKTLLTFMQDSLARSRVHYLTVEPSDLTCQVRSADEATVFRTASCYFFYLVECICLHATQLDHLVRFLPRTRAILELQNPATDIDCVPSETV